jgi:hypothetical protein
VARGARGRGSERGSAALGAGGVCVGRAGEGADGVGAVATGGIGAGGEVDSIARGEGAGAGKVGDVAEGKAEILAAGRCIGLGAGAVKSG